MPKIIENLRERLLEQTRLLVEESGFGAVTIRAVADRCGVGVGTVYNYFPSKDLLLRGYLFAQWRSRMEQLRQDCAGAREPGEALGYMFAQISAFGTTYGDALMDLGIVYDLRSEFYQNLVEHLSMLLRRFCDSDYAASFITEALVRQTLLGVPFEQSGPLLMKLF